MRTLDISAAKEIVAYLKGVLRVHSFSSETCSIKERIWLDMARNGLATTCRVRNMLKIGL